MADTDTNQAATTVDPYVSATPMPSVVPVDRANEGDIPMSLEPIVEAAVSPEVARANLEEWTKDNAEALKIASASLVAEAPPPAGVSQGVSDALAAASRMDEYQSHKRVHAGKILSASSQVISYQGTNTVFAYIPDDKIFSRGVAAPGDYLVIYEDGYVSWSPAKAFEEGYALIAANPLPSPYAPSLIERVEAAAHPAFTAALHPNNAIAQIAEIIDNMHGSDAQRRAVVQAIVERFAS